MTRRSVLESFFDLAMAAPVGRRRRHVIDSSRLDTAFAYARTLDRLTSLSIYLDGTLVRQTYQNGLDDDLELTNLKSISKGVLAILVGIAIDRRQIRSVDDRIVRYLPDAVHGPGGASGPLARLTIRQLLTMSGNIVPDYAGVAASPDWLGYILSHSPVGAPGKFLYSTASTHLLALVLAGAVRTTPLAFAERHLFRPLGITEARWQTDPQGHHIGGNDIYLGARDIARIGALMLNEGVHQGRRIVSRGWVRESVRRHVVLDHDEDPKGGLPLTGYGYLWWLTELAGLEAYMGWGYGRQYLIIVPAIRGVVVLTSRWADAVPDSYHRPVVSLINPLLASALASAA